MTCPVCGDPVSAPAVRVLDTVDAYFHRSCFGLVVRVELVFIEAGPEAAETASS
jgi:hypothetical protein